MTNDLYALQARLADETIERVLSRPPPPRAEYRRLLRLRTRGRRPGPGVTGPHKLDDVRIRVTRCAPAPWRPCIGCGKGRVRGFTYCKGCKCRLAHGSAVDSGDLPTIAEAARAKVPTRRLCPCL